MVQKSISIPHDSTPLHATTAVKKQFKGTANWALFVATIGLTLLTVIMAGAVLNAFKMSVLRGGFGMTPVFVALCYIFVNLLLLFPVWTLLQFGLRMKRAVKQEDHIAIDYAFSHMKSRLVYGGLGLLGIIALGGGLGFWLS